MKIAIINTYSDGSTGTAAQTIGEFASKQGHQIRLYYGRNKCDGNNWTFIGENKVRQMVSNFMTYLTGNVGAFHNQSTLRLIKELKQFNPDVIHLHNLHGNYLNFKKLFKFLQHFSGKIIFTLHDEFFLTGRCALCFCEKWKSGCFKCENLSAYPRVLIDHCQKMQSEKINYFKKLNNVLIITPSQWLNNLVGESKISFVEHKCIYNSFEKPSIVEFDLDNIICKGKINILFSAYTWSINKGALIIRELAKLLDKNKYNIIITGYDEYCKTWFDFECVKLGLISRGELLYLIKNVDIFVNPTFKDNLPSILIESIYMGTPAITFDTGGCKEIIDSSCGVVLKDKTSNGLFKAIDEFDFSKNWKDACKLKAESFNNKNTISKYIDEYNKSPS